MACCQTGFLLIANNLLYHNGADGILIGAGDAPGGVADSGMLVANNMILDHPVSIWGKDQTIVESGLTGTHNKYVNKLIWKNKQGLVLQDGVVAVGTMNADPRLVNYEANGSRDYHLSASSPAIGAGILMGVPRIDFDGWPRPTTTPSRHRSLPDWFCADSVALAILSFLHRTGLSAAGRKQPMTKIFAAPATRI
jgi:hypothetical protein